MLFIFRTHPGWNTAVMMITDSMTDGHQMNKQNKTNKQLAAVSSRIYSSPTMEIISLADNQNYKGISKPSASTHSKLCHLVRLLIISLKTAMKRCNRSRSILETKEQNTLPTQQSCASCVTWHAMVFMSIEWHGSENGLVMHIMVSPFLVNNKEPVSVIHFLSAHLQSLSSHLQCSWPGNVFYDL